MRILQVIMLIFSFVIPLEALSGIENLIEFASKKGGMRNFNAPTIIKDQQGGYLSGGSLLLRGPSPQELSPITIQTPKLKYDACTGSGDFRFGAMSYISGEEFSRFLKNVARASGAYLVKMSIKTACPQCEDIMTYLETVARDINNLTMNQCAMGQMIASGAFSKIVSSEKQQCMMNANLSETNSDMFETTSSCQDNAGYSKMSDSEELGDTLRNDFNLVWQALSKGSVSDSNFRELMMSVSGTVIVKKESGRYKFSYLPSLVVDKDFLKNYMGSSSGSTKIDLYSCDSKDKCLNPKLIEGHLTQDKTIYGNVSRILSSLIQKVKQDKSDFSDEEEALLSFSTIPLLNLIEIEAASKSEDADMLVRMGEFMDAVCFDIMTNYMQVIISRVTTHLKNMEYGQIDNTIIENFTKDCEYVKNHLRDAKFGAFQKLQLVMQVKERIEKQVKEYELGFARFVSEIENR